MKRICVFCGSAPGVRPEYAAAARDLGTGLAGRGIGLVWGGGNVGLMGAVADAVLAAGGDAIGVIPAALAERELAHRGARDLRVVANMHERKALMAELSDAFIALPGGLGTLEELFEAWTWTQLGFQHKPLAVLDTADFYAPLLAHLDRARDEGFVRPRHRDLVIVERDPVRLLDRLVPRLAPGAREPLPADV